MSSTRRVYSTLTCFAFATAVGCGLAAPRPGFDNDEDNPGDPTADVDAGDAGENSIDPGFGGGNAGKSVEVTGTTYAPNEDFALSGVLVYWTTTEPAPIPDGVYCDSCVELPENTSTISAVDGTFTLKVPAEREIFVVAQKGQFRRVRKVTLKETDDRLDREYTTLPGRSRPNQGDSIPKIAIMEEQTTTTFDMVQTALRGLGIEEWDTFNDNMSRVVNDLHSYHMVMFPCGSSSPSAAARDAVRDYVAAGGKVYVSDHAHAWADTTFPEFFQSAITTGKSGTPTTGEVVDQGMADWLSAIGDNPSNIPLQGIWSTFNGLKSADAPTPENNGNTITVEPKVWTRVTASGYGTGEGSASFRYGCGRGMVSTFHVKGTSPNNLLPQEKALLYTLLEVSSCIQPGSGVH